MTNAQQALERLTAANPVPDSASPFPAAGLSPAALLARIEERSTPMTETPTLIRKTEPVEPRGSRRRGPVIAMIAAAAAIAAIVAATTLLTGEADPVATPTELAQEFFAALEGGDVAGYEAMFAAEATFDCLGGPCVGGAASKDDLLLGFARDSRYISVSGANLDVNCSPVPDGASCFVTVISGLNPGDVIDEKNMEFDLSNSLITQIRLERGASWIGRDAIGFGGYRSWMQLEHPSEFDSLFALGSSILLETEEVRAQHRELMAEYVDQLDG